MQAASFMFAILPSKLWVVTDRVGKYFRDTLFGPLQENPRFRQHGNILENALKRIRIDAVICREEGNLKTAHSGAQLLNARILHL